MGDFIIDFRDPANRCNDGSVLQFCTGIEVDEIRRDSFTLLVSRVGSRDLWGTFEADDGLAVALAGRVALEEEAWRSAQNAPGRGGLACKAIYQAYKQGGPARVGELSGSYAIHIHDPEEGWYYLVTDRAGAFPCYAGTAEGGLLWASHPDVLADLQQGAANWDLTSIAEFISTGVVSFPHSYYREVSAMEYGSIHSVSLGPGRTRLAHTSRRLSGGVEEDDSLSETQLTGRLAKALRASVGRRTLPRLGRSAIALSGGLDSRTILCAAGKHENLVAFCAFDEKNTEYELASEIAKAEGIELIPLRRTYEHYADSAELGVKIS